MVLLLLLCTLNASLAGEEGSLNFGPFVWVSAGATDAACLPRLCRERAATSEFHWDEGERGGRELSRSKEYIVFHILLQKVDNDVIGTEEEL